MTVENGMDDTIAPLFDLFKGNRDYVQFQDETAGHFVLTGNDIRNRSEQTGARLINMKAEGFRYPAQRITAALQSLQARRPQINL